MAEVPKITGDQFLHDIVYDNVEFVRAAIEQGMDVNYADVFSPGKQNALAVAIKYNSVRSLELLLENGAQIEKEHIKSPLWSALDSGHEECALLLIKYGANINARLYTTNEGILHIAAKNNLLRVAEALLEKGYDVNSTNQKGNTPIDCAAEKDHAEMAELLLKNNALTGKPVSREITTIHRAAQNNSVKTLKILSQHLDNIGAYLYESNDVHKSSLMCAINHREAFDELLKHTPPGMINYVNEEGISAISLAATAKTPEALESLIRHGANFNPVADENNLSFAYALHPLKEAITSGYPQNALLLVTSGASISTDNLPLPSLLQCIGRYSKIDMKKNPENQEYWEALLKQVEAIAKSNLTSLNPGRTSPGTTLINSTANLTTPLNIAMGAS